MAVTSGVLINAATGVLNFSPGSNQGIRVLDAELFNQGTVNINRTPSFTKPITNEGLFDIVSGVTLTLSGAIQTFTQSAGTLNVNGAMNIASGATLTNDGGSISGTLLVASANLHMGPLAGPISAIVQRSSSYSGDLPAGSTLVVQGISANSATLTAAAGFTNAGTITLESIAPAATRATPPWR